MATEKKNSKPTQNEKQERFTRVAAQRMGNICKHMDLLSGCGNRSSYEPTKDQIDKIEKTLTDKTKSVIESLRGNGGKGGFSF